MGGTTSAARSVADATSGVAEPPGAQSSKPGVTDVDAERCAERQGRGSDAQTLTLGGRFCVNVVPIGAENGGFSKHVDADSGV